MRKIFYILYLIRPHNMLAAVLCVGAGHWMASSGSRPPLLLLGAVALVTAAGNVINDYYDIDIDIINRPKRMLPSRSLSRRTAFLVYLVILLLLALTFSGLKLVESCWLAIWVVLLHFYSRSLKRLLLIGNLAVAIVTGSGFLLGALSGGEMSAGVLPAVLTFFFVFGREIVKDCEDLEGDRQCGAKTLPVLWGAIRSSRVAGMILLILAMAFLMPWLIGLYSDAYGFIMVISVLPLLLLSFIFSLLGRRFGLVSTLLKIGMFAGIAAFIVA